MKRLGHLLAVIAMALTGSTALAAEVVKKDNLTVDVGGRLQLTGFIQRLEDNFRDDNRAYLYLRQARLWIDGDVNDIDYKLTLGFISEDEVKAPSPGVSLGLLDMYADVPVKALGNFRIRAGQFKIPYSLERMKDPGALPFTDRSIANVAFRVGREIGFMGHTDLGGLKLGLGIFTGGGRDIPERYLPQKLGIPMISGRIGYDNGMYKNVFTEKPQTKLDRLGYGVGVNAFYTKDTQIGHGSAFSVRLGERPLILNTNWNPYLSRTPVELGEWMQVGGDAAVAVPMGAGTVLGEAEYNWGSFKNSYGSVSISAVRAQVGYELEQFSAHARYAVVFPDKEMTTGGVWVTGGRPFHEVTPSLVYTYSPNVKMVAELPIAINTPVVQENNIGSYVLTEQPDQASYLRTAGNSVSRQNVINARLMFQATF